MGTKNAFLKDVEYLLKRLETNKDRLKKAKHALTEKHIALKQERIETLQACVAELLPDLHDATIQKLKREIPGFITHEIKKEIEGVRTAGASFWKHLMGTAEEYKAEKIKNMLDSLRIRLASTIDIEIDSFVEKPKSIRALQKIDVMISEKQKKLEALHHEGREIEAKIKKLQDIQTVYGSKKTNRVSQKMAKEVARLARNDRAQISRSGHRRSDRGGYSQSNYDDGDFLCDIVIPAVILMSLFSDSDQGPYETGGSYEGSAEAVGSSEDGGQESANVNEQESFSNEDNADRGDLS